MFTYYYRIKDLITVFEHLCITFFESSNTTLAMQAECLSL